METISRRSDTKEDRGLGVQRRGPLRRRAPARAQDQDDRGDQRAGGGARQERDHPGDSHQEARGAAPGGARQGRASGLEARRPLLLLCGWRHGRRGGPRRPRRHCEYPPAPARSSCSHITIHTNLHPVELTDNLYSSPSDSPLTPPDVFSSPTPPQPARLSIITYNLYTSNMIKLYFDINLFI